jgi:thiol-disulfide isomerase/thioredoxin
MIKATSFVTFVFILAACHPKPKPNYISIKGDVHTMAKELNGRKLYLADINNRTIIDSTVIVNGQFSFFRDSVDDSFQPYFAWIKYRDTANNIRFLRPLGVINPYNNVDDCRFYVDRGETVLRLDSLKNLSKDYYGHTILTMHIIKGSIQNEPLYKNLLLRYTREGNSRRLKYNDSIIRAYPYSIYLLDQLYANKEFFNVKDLQYLLRGFSEDLQASKTCKQFESYFDYLSRPDKTNPQLFLPDETGRKNFVIDANASCQLLVFWASWCGPCRQEIPTLKTIYNKYQSKGLSIASISIDKNKDDWSAALSYEKMPWNQFVVDESAEPEVDIKYNITAVPSLFLIDKNQKMIKIDGHHPEKLDSIINEHLSRSTLNNQRE